MARAHRAGEGFADGRRLLASLIVQARVYLNLEGTENLAARHVRVGSWAAVRHNARMLQHCLSKQTLCRRDCRPHGAPAPSDAPRMLIPFEGMRPAV
jgi:hypothetical protein